MARCSAKTGIAVEEEAGGKNRFRAAARSVMRARDATMLPYFGSQAWRAHRHAVMAAMLVEDDTRRSFRYFRQPV